jgi:hypothetical protein
MPKCCAQVPVPAAGALLDPAWQPDGLDNAAWDRLCEYRTMKVAADATLREAQTRLAHARTELALLDASDAQLGQQVSSNACLRGNQGLHERRSAAVVVTVVMAAS